VVEARKTGWASRDQWVSEVVTGSGRGVSCIAIENMWENRKNNYINYK